MKDGRHITLAFETSCDETAVALLADGRHVLANIISSQIPVHQAFGGVVPEVASRHHLDNISGVLDRALEESGCRLEQVDLVAATAGPGLVGALLIGLATAKAVAFVLDKPLVGVNHMQGHISANYIEYPDLEPPFLAFIVSGGHTELIDVIGYNEFEILGRTRDDAAGEAFDKVARVLGLGYPGGPGVDRAARGGDPEAVPFKRVLLARESLDFSFSGLKTGVLNYLNIQKLKGAPVPVADVAASFQQSVVDVLVAKAMLAVEQTGRDRLALAGGVAANSRLRAALQEACDARGIRLYRPAPLLCTDNAAMIGCAAYYRAMEGLVDPLDLDADPSLELQA